MVRCKFRCHFKDEVRNVGTGEILYVNIIMSPVYTGSQENETFYKYTPSGELRFNTINVDASKQIELGKEYYIDITEA